jgi:hypothetical protein
MVAVTVEVEGTSMVRVERWTVVVGPSMREVLMRVWMTGGR